MKAVHILTNMEIVFLLAFGALAYVAKCAVVVVSVCAVIKYAVKQLEQ